MSATKIFFLIYFLGSYVGAALFFGLFYEFNRIAHIANQEGNFIVPYNKYKFPFYLPKNSDIILLLLYILFSWASLLIEFGSSLMIDKTVFKRAFDGDDRYILRNFIFKWNLSSEL